MFFSRRGVIWYFSIIFEEIRFEFHQKIDGFVSCASFFQITTVRAPLQAAACIFFTLFFTAGHNKERLILQTIYALNKEIFL